MVDHQRISPPEQAGDRIRGSHAEISRLELGRTSFKERDVRDLLNLGLEHAALSIRTFEAQLVPGLLQTEAYARAVVALGHENVEATRRVELRAAATQL